ncbi:unnamed protein product [Strongylus vulgaris]|uniref:Secreted protein n=1 Tax=Strongylus vulgaris TaxID=40348 RepID=A0A3P7IZB1_STRVU|nr:unnamed protein product [Strongylus vulgaris]
MFFRRFLIQLLLASVEVSLAKSGGLLQLPISLYSLIKDVHQPIRVRSRHQLPFSRSDFMRNNVVIREENDRSVVAASTKNDLVLVTKNTLAGVIKRKKSSGTHFSTNRRATAISSQGGILSAVINSLLTPGNKL